MKTQIRRGVFETNSSSSHSLVITTANEYYTKEEQRKIVRRTDYRVKEEMDKSLKDLKAWIEYDKYLKSIGEEIDIL